MRLLTDPLLRKRVLHLRRVVDVDPGPASNVDAVLISHLHNDHLDLPSAPSTRPIVPHRRTARRRPASDQARLSARRRDRTGRVDRRRRSHDRGNARRPRRQARTARSQGCRRRVSRLRDGARVLRRRHGPVRRHARPRAGPRRRDPARRRLGPQAAARAPERAPSCPGTHAPPPACRNSRALGDVPQDRAHSRPCCPEGACRVLRASLRPRPHRTSRSACWTPARASTSSRSAPG